MSDDAPDHRLDDLADRLRAVERAATDGDTAVADLGDAAAVHERLDDLRADVDELAQRLDALDATVQSLHGYVGELDAVNDRVERRADAARAAVDRLEARRQRLDSSDEHSATDLPDTVRDEEADGATRPRPAADASPRSDAATANVDGTDRTAARDTGGDESLLERVRDSL